MFEIDHPPLRQLYDLNRTLRQRESLLGSGLSPGLERVGLCLMSDLFRSSWSPLEKPVEAGDWCRPLNTYPFAVTGGEDTQFGLLVEKDRVTAESPVVLTVPHSGGNAEASNFIVGENLIDFLCLGYYRGYFSLEQLAFGFRDTLNAHLSPDWKPDKADVYIEMIEEEEQAVLDALIEAFDLEPSSYDLETFLELQDRHKPKLNYPPDEEQ